MNFFLREHCTDSVLIPLVEQYIVNSGCSGGGSERYLIIEDLAVAAGY
jgi:hypothetical protein